MAHEITASDSVALRLTGAWHGLGTIIPDGLSAYEAMEKIGIDWTVSTRPIRLTERDGDIDSHRAIVRDDDNSVLSIVSDTYQPLQNRTLAALADSLADIDAGKSITIESAGTLKGGRKVWFLVRSETTTMGGDEVAPYLMLGNAHDGSMAVTVIPTAVRVVCANTFGLADRLASQRWSWRHTSRLALRGDEMRDTITRWRSGMNGAKIAADTLAAAQVNTERVRNLWTAVYEDVVGKVEVNPKDDIEHRRKERFVKAMHTMTATFDKERSTMKSSMWLAVNAATNWIQHSYGTKDVAESAYSSWVGNKARQTSDAFTTALKML